MHKEIAEKLVTALRSGDYIQGTDALRTADDKFCCLGVLCEIAMKEGVIPEWTDETVLGKIIYSAAGQTGILPLPVKEWAGMKSNNGSYKTGADSDEADACLSYDNDNGSTFSEIADFIEKRYAEL